MATKKTAAKTPYVPKIGDSVKFDTGHGRKGKGKIESITTLGNGSSFVFVKEDGKSKPTGVRPSQCTLVSRAA